MVQETPVNTGDQKGNAAGTDSIDALLSALRQLKSNISHVEEQHPSLRNDLSSLCDLVIGHLNRSPEDIDILFKEKLQNLGHEEDSKIIRELQAVIENLPPETDSQCAQSHESDNVISSQDDSPVPDIVLALPHDLPETAQPPVIQHDVQISAFSPAASNSKPLTNAFDKAGDGLLTGLDKMGDGVIFVFEKLLKLGSKKK